jgi:hypothetical protein
MAAFVRNEGQYPTLSGSTHLEKRTVRNVLAQPAAKGPAF